MNQNQLNVNVSALYSENPHVMSTFQDLVIIDRLNVKYKYFNIYHHSNSVTHISSCKH